MLDFLKLQLQSILALWNAGIFTSGYAYILYAILIGPLCSLIKLDILIWNFFSSFDTQFNNITNRIFNAFDVILDGSVWWLVLNEIFFQPFLIKSFNWKFLIVTFAPPAMLKFANVEEAPKQAVINTFSIVIPV